VLEQLMKEDDQEVDEGRVCEIDQDLEAVMLDIDSIN
jgi:hypothetical protein